MLGRGKGLLRDYVIPGTVGAVGGVALDVAWGYIQPKFFPTMTAGWSALAAKLGVVLGATWLLQKFAPAGFRTPVHNGAVGATTVLVYGAMRGAIHGQFPTLPGLAGYMDFHSYAIPGSRMAGYMPRTLGSLEDLYSPAAVIQPAGTAVPRQFGGYIAAQPGMGGYMQPHMSGNGGLMGYDWQSDGM
jgi:hypothetical protein